MRDLDNLYMSENRDLNACLGLMREISKEFPYFNETLLRTCIDSPPIDRFLALEQVTNQCYLKFAYEEEELINQFRDEVANNAPTRLILIATPALMALGTDPRNAPHLAKLCLDKIGKLSFHAEQTESDLTSIITSSMIAGDIPYFTKVGNSLYYGKEENGILLGTKD